MGKNDQQKQNTVKNATTVNKNSCELRNNAGTAVLDSSDNDPNTSKSEGLVSIDIIYVTIRSIINQEVKKACDELSSHFATRIDFLEAEVTRLNTATDAKMTKNFDELKTCFEKSQRVVTNLIKVPSDANPIGTAVNDAIKEQDDRESKKNNIMLFNLPESKKLEVENKKADDEAKLNEIINILSIKPKVNAFFRLGKPDNSKVRPLLVKLETEEQKQSFLSNAKKLGLLDPTDLRKKVVIKKDCTKLELETEKVLVNEMKERRNCGEDVVIRNGKIVARRVRSE
jgi:hypothetical protein